MRPDWDRSWMDVAQVIALRAPCSRARVGAVIVDIYNRIVATGYNGPPAGYKKTWEYECDGSEGEGYCLRGRFGPDEVDGYDSCPTIHAEMNALSFCDRRHREGGTLYCTSVCCKTCSKVVANSGLARLVCCEEPEDRSHRGWEQSLQFLRSCGIEVVMLGG